MTNDQPTVDLETRTRDANWQKAQIAASTPEFSHSDELPLKLTIKKTGVFCRRLKVRTIEEVWYRDAVLKVTVPAGFASDLASIPPALWCVLSPWDIALEALFHDLLYREQPVKRAVADAALLSMLEERGEVWYVRWPVYWTVRLFGGRSWRNNAAGKLE